ncbi:MAG TPA: flagellar export chaperone FliS [Deltaproteobacteria bacterium]|nr:flagellar export chaperone FliS [Deltaproteobacteria bacterium]
MTMNSAGFQAYRKTQIQTADQGSLILMCYDGAIRFLKQAQSAHSTGDHQKLNLCCTKASNVLWELANSINLEAGAVAVNLQSLYNYMIRRIVDAQYHGRIEAMDEVIAYLKELRDSWEQIIKKQN